MTVKCHYQPNRNYFCAVEIIQCGMQKRESGNISDFRVIGINYKKTDTSTRGRFAVNNEQYIQLLLSAASCGLSELFVLSTCNRTEIYGLAPSSELLISLLCNYTTGSAEEFTQLAYEKTGEEAIRHLFHVSSGLDSQILGDYEIQAQLKIAVKLSKQNGCIGSFLERLLNGVMQSSKAIKTNTLLSDGTVSVSFAAIQFIREHIADIKVNNILLIGTGKIGRNACNNIKSYLHTTNVTLINRSPEKAEALAKNLGFRHAPAADLDKEVAAADIILVASNSATPIVTVAQMRNSVPKLVIDLSVPCNAEPAIAALPGTTLVNVDTLSAIKDKTLRKRMREVPKANAIIEQHIHEFTEWHSMRRHVPVLLSVKEILHSISAYPIVLENNCPHNQEQKIQAAIKSLAVKMKQQQPHGCDCIEVIRSFVA